MEAREMQKAAIIMARAAELNATVAMMQAKNLERTSEGMTAAYDEKAFDDAIIATGCNHNSICEVLQGY